MVKDHKFCLVDGIATILVIIGALNWGLIGFFKFNLVSAIFGDMTTAARIVYAIVGIAGLWGIFMCIRKYRCCKATHCEPTPKV